MEGAEASTAQSIICSSAYQDDSPISLIIGHLLTVSLIFILFVLTFKFSRKIHLFPAKERSPLLTVIQMIYFTSTLFSIYLTEIIVLFEVSWDAESQNEIHFSRKFFKALYISLRLCSFPIYILR